MKYQTIISLILLPQLAPALGAAVPNGDDSVGLQKRNIKDVIKNKLNHVGEQKSKALKVAGQGIEVAGKGVQATGKGLKVAGNGIKFAGGKGVKAAGQGIKAVGKEIHKLEAVLQETFTVEPEFEGIWDELRDVLPACAKSDCKNNIFMNEALRWVKYALKDIGVVVHENPAATAALVIGVSVLLIELISGGVLVPIALRAIGFGRQGPIKNTIAAAVQRVINPVKLGSVFSRFQSAAMHGAALKELQNLAHIAITGLVGAGIAGLVEAGIKHDHFTHRQEWRSWVSESRIDVSSDVATLIDDVGFKTPLGCVDEGPKKGVVGLWYVPTNATQCMPRWSKFEDEGCMLYGRRRRFSRLMGLKNNGDWKGVCESTPAIIDDKHYDQPSYCDDKGVAGIYGVFDIVDEQCECSCVRT